MENKSISTPVLHHSSCYQFDSGPSNAASVFNQQLKQIFFVSGAAKGFSKKKTIIPNKLLKLKYLSCKKFYL